MTLDTDSNLIVITGAASGMGEATAALMAGEDRHVLLCDLNEGRLRGVADRIANAVSILVGDISDPTYGTKLTAAIANRRIAGFIHCAGLSPAMAGPARILEVNLAATLRLAATIRPLMAEGAAAVLVASSAGQMIGTALDPQIRNALRPEGVPSLISLAPDAATAYSVSKRGVQLLVQRDARSFGERGARLLSLSPGVIDTPMGRLEAEHKPIIQRMVDASALQRGGHAREVASVAAFLCSRAASYVTGVDILVDGGAVAGLSFGSAPAPGALQ